MSGVRRNRRRPPRPLLAALVVTLVLGLTVAALWPVYVRPHTDLPVRADAILVLGGAHDGRAELGLRLAREGHAPRVLFSDPYETSARMNRICHGGYSFEVRCFDPDPRTTRGEGRALAAYARAEGWTRVIVVTFTPHISRARYVIGKCWDGELLFVDPRPELSVARWAYDYLYQSAAYVEAFFEDC